MAGNKRQIIKTNLSFKQLSPILSNTPKEPPPKKQKVSSPPKRKAPQRKRSAPSKKVKLPSPAESDEDEDNFYSSSEEEEDPVETIKTIVSKLGNARLEQADEKAAKEKAIQNKVAKHLERKKLITAIKLYKQEFKEQLESFKITPLALEKADTDKLKGIYVEMRETIGMTNNLGGQNYLINKAIELVENYDHYIGWKLHGLSSRCRQSKELQSIIKEITMQNIIDNIVIESPYFRGALAFGMIASSVHQENTETQITDIAQNTPATKEIQEEVMNLPLPPSTTPKEQAPKKKKLTEMTAGDVLSDKSLASEKIVYAQTETIHSPPPRSDPPPPPKKAETTIMRRNKIRQENPN